MDNDTFIFCTKEVTANVFNGFFTVLGGIVVEPGTLLCGVRDVLSSVCLDVLQTANC